MGGSPSEDLRLVPSLQLRAREKRGWGADSPTQISHITSLQIICLFSDLGLSCIDAIIREIMASGLHKEDPNSSGIDVLGSHKAANYRRGPISRSYETGANEIALRATGLLCLSTGRP